MQVGYPQRKVICQRQITTLQATNRNNIYLPRSERKALYYRGLVFG